MAPSSSNNGMVALPSPNTVAKDAVQSSADAISSMSISGISGISGGVGPGAGGPNAASESTKQGASGNAGIKAASYAAGQKVYYKSASYAGAAEVVSVHLDDDLVPYYTIRVEGKEKQTDDSHLSAMTNDSNSSGSGGTGTGTGGTTPREQVQHMLGNLSDAQLEQVAAFVRQLTLSSAASSSSAPSPSRPSTPGRMPATTEGGGGIPSPTPSGPSPMHAAIQPAHPRQQQQQPAPPGQAQVRDGRRSTVGAFLFVSTHGL
jgi:hypothetical protein